jgi:cytochrome c oxidase cbb3-type subunit 4
MKQDGLKYFTDTHLTLIALFIFFLYFAYVVIRTYSINKNKINSYAQIPLEEETSK